MPATPAEEQVTANIQSSATEEALVPETACLDSICAQDSVWRALEVPELQFWPMCSFDGELDCILWQVDQIVLDMSCFVLSLRPVPLPDHNAGLHTPGLDSKGPAKKPRKGLTLGVRCCVYTDSALEGKRSGGWSWRRDMHGRSNNGERLAEEWAVCSCPCFASLCSSPGQASLQIS